MPAQGARFLRRAVSVSRRAATTAAAAAAAAPTCGCFAATAAAASTPSRIGARACGSLPLTRSFAVSAAAAYAYARPYSPSVSLTPTMPSSGGETAALPAGANGAADAVSPLMTPMAKGALMPLSASRALRQMYASNEPSRLKTYEAAGELLVIPPESPFVVRLDGVSFYRLTKGVTKPFDLRITRAMRRTAMDLMSHFSPTTVYTQSDEISLVYLPAMGPQSVNHDKQKRRPNAVFPHLYAGRIIKIASTIASYTAVRFNYHLQQEDWTDLAPQHQRTLLNATACFDGRAFACSYEDLANQIFWRSNFDGLRNAVSHFAQSVLPAGTLQGRNLTQQLELLAERGRSPFAEVEPCHMWGTWLKRETYQMPASAFAHRLPTSMRPAASDGPVAEPATGSADDVPEAKRAKVSDTSSSATGSPSSSASPSASSPASPPPPLAAVAASLVAQQDATSDTASNKASDPSSNKSSKRGRSRAIPVMPAFVTRRRIRFGCFNWADYTPAQRLAFTAAPLWLDRAPDVDVSTNTSAAPAGSLESSLDVDASLPQFPWPPKSAIEDDPYQPQF